MKRFKRTLAVVLAGSMCAGGMAAQAAGTGTEKAEIPAAYSVDDGLILDFDMESLEGSAVINKADSTAFQVEGNSPALTEGKEGHGQALLFDGRTNYLNLGTDYQIPDSQATIAAWVKIDPEPNGLSRIICRSRTTIPGENDIALQVRNNGKLEANLPEWFASGEGLVSFDEWQHVAVTSDGGTQTMYVNGEAVQTIAAAEIDPDWQEAGLLIGAGWNAQGTEPFADHMFKGAMDDLKVYTRALTGDEIKTLAEAEEQGGGEDAELPDALYEFTMDEIKDGTGDLEGQKVIVNETDGTEYPIYGGASVDEFGIYGKSVMFNGSDSYADIGNPDINNVFTLSAWVYLEPDAVNNMNKLFGRDRTTVPEDMFYIAIRGDRQGEVECALNGGGVNGAAGTVPFGEWVNFAVTNTPDEACLYINGRLVSKGNGSDTDQRTNPMNMLIGCGYNAAGNGIFNGHAFKGRIDDVRIYNEALTGAQIRAYTEGILDSVPPEVNAVSPAEGELISASGRLQIVYNMAVSLGDQPVSVRDSEGRPVDANADVEDTSENIEGTETLVITPAEKLTSGETYTYVIPSGAVVNEKGMNNLAVSYTYTTAVDLEGSAADSGMEYWVIDGRADMGSSITEEDGRVIMTNGLVERVFDLDQNFLTVGYKNLYTDISLLDEDNLQSDVRITLNDKYEDGESDTDYPCYIGGVDDSLPVFQYVDYSVENSTEEPYHWEYDERISPEFMKDTPWPAEGKALVVNYEAPDNIDPLYAGVKVQVRYEIYDGIPAISKTVNVTNEGVNDVIVHRMSTEVLPSSEGLKDALYMDSDMNMGNNNHDRNNGQHVFKEWQGGEDGDGLLLSSYAVSTANQSNLFGMDSRNFGPNYRLGQGESFTSYKLYEMFHSSSYFEWQNLEIKKIYRVLFPQTQDAPLIYHCISSDPGTLRTAIDQAYNAGFNMVLMSFGSGIDTENTDPAYMQRYKEVIDYAHSKDILVGAYMMLTARGGGETHSGIWGTMRCINSETSHTTMQNTLTFIDNTGLDCLEIDGSYPGSLCEHADHGGHEGIEDSVVKQWGAGVRDYYKELRERNVYINAPDWQYMAGAGMGVMGYVEAGFNVTPQAQLVYGREMAYYGTFEKIPAMGWTLVPLSPYQGGSDSSFWPYNDNILEYDFMVGMNMLYGVVGSYRGGNGLYQEGPAQNVMETWGEFYNKYREILGGDIIHITPPLRENLNSTTTEAVDGFLHVSPDSGQKGLAAFFNQTTETVTQKVTIPLYFTGLTDCRTAPAPVEGSHYRTSYVATEMEKVPSVPDIPETAAEPTDKTAYVCIGDMDGQEYTIDSNGNIEVELTMEPNTYTWLTIYDPGNVPADIGSSDEIAVPRNLAVNEITSSQVTLTWDAVQMNGRDVKEYHIYRDEEYIGKTFQNSYTDTGVEENQNYIYKVSAVHNTVSGQAAEVEASTVTDQTAPEITAVKAVSGTQVQVTFSEAMDVSSVENAANYAIAGAQAQAAVYDSVSHTVTLTSASALTPFIELSVTVSNVTDLAGNAIIPNSGKSFVFGYLRQFSFEEEDGSTAVDSINGADAAINGVQAVRTEGISGKGLAFDGDGNYVNAGDIVSAMTEYSISGWFKPESTDGNQTLIGQQRDAYDGWRWNLYLEDGVLKFDINNGKGSYPGVESQDEIAVELNSGSALAKAGQWNQFAVVRNEDTFALYLNGTKAAEETKAGIDQNGTPYASWFGGYNNNAGGEPTAQFKGVMDEIVYYNTPITETKVKDLYDECAEAEPVSKALLERFLNTAKAHVENGDVDSCVESVRKLFAEAVAEGEAVMADENASKDEVIQASRKLMLAINALDMKAADKTDLEMAVELADMLDLTDYTAAGQQEFKDALAMAKEVLADGDTMQPGADEAWGALVEAIGNLRLKADKAVLEALLNEAAGLDLSLYTEESAAVFRMALASAQAVFADETLSEEDQQKVEEAAAVLKEAKNGLTVKADDTGDESEDGQKPDDSQDENQGGNTGIDNDSSSGENDGSAAGGNDSGVSDVDQGGSASGAGSADQTDGNAQNKGDVRQAAKTSDPDSILWMIGLMALVSASGAAALTAYRKRRR